VRIDRYSLVRCVFRRVEPIPQSHGAAVILQLQVYLRNHGYRSVRINGKSDSELRRALAERLRDPEVRFGFGAEHIMLK
jgi:hypothetical protein